ncbi:hypothetical protein E2C01_052570 [Portunus trituberculatus]|uniref:Uncharacterized protein n=1 Tax=Portunus trituberculatus TaxID=210409 RepID=A0A5B7GM48_PORTR|nr:hypothetical protein [Portunus trituberculatus]
MACKAPHRWLLWFIVVITLHFHLPELLFVRYAWAGGTGVVFDWWPEACKSPRVARYAARHIFIAVVQSLPYKPLYISTRTGGRRRVECECRADVSE